MGKKFVRNRPVKPTFGPGNFVPENGVWNEKPGGITFGYFAPAKPTLWQRIKKALGL